jgi:hypothetical protein
MRLSLASNSATLVVRSTSLGPWVSEQENRNALPTSDRTGRSYSHADVAPWKSMMADKWAVTIVAFLLQPGTKTAGRPLSVALGLFAAGGQRE